jgi:hypothetical protein
MLSRETLDHYREMTLGERLQLTLDAIEASAPYLAHGTPEVVARRFQLLHRENDLRNENMLRAFARMREQDKP